MSATLTTDDARSHLLRCASELLEESGSQALSVRRVSDRAGLSSGAPYYHFADRRALLIALALDGFDQLQRRADAVLAGSALSPAGLLLALSDAFLDFCADHPQLIDLMYESELTRPIDPMLEPAYRRAFELVVNVLQRAQSDRPSSEALVRAVTFWTSLFGLSRVLGHRLLEPFEAEIDGSWREAILETIIEAAVRR